MIGLLLLFAGEAGIGKSSALAKLALDWTQRGNEIIRLVFVMQLKSVSNKDKSLEELIIESHEGLDITEESLKGHLQNSDCPVLIVLDGLDEYKLGTNKVIDKIIDRGLGSSVMNGLVLITSRAEAQNLHVIERKVNKVLVMTGFNAQNSITFVKSFFRTCGNESYSSVFMEQEIGALLRVPIMLLMACLLYKENQDQHLPTNRTDILGAIVDLILDRKRDRKLSEEEKKELKLRIGKIAWDTAEKDVFPFEQVGILG